MEFRYQWTGRHNFSDRSSMNPYAIFPGYLIQGMLWQKTKLLLYSLNKALFPDSPNAEYRRKQYDRQYGRYMVH